MNTILYMNSFPYETVYLYELICFYDFIAHRYRHYVISRLTRTKVKKLKQNGDAAPAPCPPLLQPRLIVVLVSWIEPSETRNEINHLYEIICLSDFAAAYCRFGASTRTSCLHLPLATQPPHPSLPAMAD